MMKLFEIKKKFFYLMTIVFLHTPPAGAYFHHNPPQTSSTNPQPHHKTTTRTHKHPQTLYKAHNTPPLLPTPYLRREKGESSPASFLPFINVSVYNCLESKEINALEKHKEKIKHYSIVINRGETEKEKESIYKCFKVLL